jgi:hypothetical protein
MKIYNDYMHDLFVILVYEFYDFFKPLLFFYIYYIFLIFKIWLYIPKTTRVNLKKVAIIYNSNIIFSNYININYYHIKIFLDNKFFTLRGNSNYSVLNRITFIKFNTSPIISIHEVPIKLYPEEECNICYSYPGTLNGLCGHQNICSECASKLNKCPYCRESFVQNPLYLKKILYLI